jgi:hypothetical protein
MKAMSGTGTARARPTSILDVQEWIAEHHGFVPHPFWIDHCLELYLGSATASEGRPPWHECPEDKREAIREAFIHFGLLPD